MTIFVGITGGIATGKSTIVKFLKKSGYKVHDSDLIVNKIYSQPNKKLFAILKKIGLSKSIKKNQINKKIIRDEIFSNKTKKKKIRTIYSQRSKNITKSFYKKTQKQKKQNYIFRYTPSF